MLILERSSACDASQPLPGDSILIDVDEEGPSLDAEKPVSSRGRS